MDYREAEAYLLDVPRFTKKNTPEDTRAFLERLGNPALDRKILHIAGTNGKGSVCAYLASVYQRAGYRVGLFTSPHLVTMRERIRVDNRMISERDFAACLETVLALQKEIRGDAEYRPTFFETLFFMAMLYFERKRAELIVLETGLGGRLDATNSVDEKELCVITRIGLDHTEYLGDTLRQIAGEKAGILRPGVPVVFSDDEWESAGAIRKRAEALGCPAYSVSKRDVRNLEFHKNFIDFSYDTRYYGCIRCSLGSLAPYQAENAALALRAVDVLAERLPVGGQALLDGMRGMVWEGRMEELLPGVYVDGAHNEDGVRAFLDAARRGKSGRRLLLFSAVGDKRYEQMIRLIAASRLFDRVFVTRLRSARGLPLRTLTDAFRRAGVAAYGFDGAELAFHAALSDKGPEDTLYVAGSLYLAGEIKAIAGERSGDMRTD